MMKQQIPSTQDFQFIGGSLSLDFVNTVGNRLGESRDYFSTTQDIARWIAMSSCLPHMDRIRINRTDMAGIRTRREYLYALFLPFANGKKWKASRRLTALNRDIHQLWHRKNLRHEAGQFCWAFDGTAAEQLAHAIVSDAADLLASGRCELIRQCQDSSCGWLFLDRSREKKRRWCSMRDCGNRAKARRFYAQHRGEGTA